MSLAELQELERGSVIASYARMPVEFVRGEGSRLWDSEGNEYLDLLCGISVTRGWQWPRFVTEIPHRKSRYSFPSASHSREPSPRTNSTGIRA